MKKFLPIILLLSFFSINAQGQQEAKPESLLGRYKWTQKTITYEIEGYKESQQIIQDTLISKYNQEFRVVGTTTNYVIFYILLYEDTLSANYTNYNFSNGDTPSSIKKEGFLVSEKRKYFKVEKVKLEHYAIKLDIIKLDIEAGAINLPFKLRIQKNNFNFEGALSLNAGLGIVLPTKAFRKYKQTIILGAGLSSVKLDSVSVLRNHETLVSTNDFTTFTAIAGFALERNKIQIAILTGFDWLTRNNQNKFGWKHQGKPWVSIGLGYSIFSGGNEKTQTSKDGMNPTD